MHGNYRVRYVERGTGVISKKMFLEFELYRQNTVPIKLDADNSERANVIDNV